MSTTGDRPYRLSIWNAAARAMAERGELEGSTFRRYPPRSFSTESAAIARARNLLTEMYDPRIPYESQPHAVIHQTNVIDSGVAYVHLPYGDIVRTDQVTSFDLALSDLRVTKADVAQATRSAEMRHGLREALGLWNAFSMLAAAGSVIR